jgi:hypothetical protein
MLVVVFSSRFVEYLVNFDTTPTDFELFSNSMKKTDRKYLVLSNKKMLTNTGNI